ncbi:beta-fructofuranosidase, insoluble isoenzyme 7-like [Typha latifolia]|uniref:beta-fructofuranosidase, insoluble isoenzyme 7-like n=1 Tax=Typha latifolia TaxID=4733 RepID=UPI003C2D1DCB
MARSNRPLSLAFALISCTILYSFFVFDRINADASPAALPFPESVELCSKGVGQDRTAYHFQPHKYWLNDPNGPLYHNGIYHLFYQHNPKSALWGNISWAHSISTDLINWRSLDLALDRTDSYDINGCWSGSITVLPGDRPVILYTGIDSENRQVQNIAFPKNDSDPLLREWIKPEYNPIILPDEDLIVTKFRDPTTAWLGHDGHWRITIAALVAEMATALLYRSKDFVHWVRAESPLYFSQISGMWECPDFFPVSLKGKEGLDTSVNADNTKHVLKVSLMRTSQDYYILGRYDEGRDTFVPEDSSVIDDYRVLSRMDYGNFYASKSFFDKQKNRRVVWAWSNESDSTSDAVKKGWAGIMSFPRTIWLDSNGKQLVQWPIEEIESLRREEVHLYDLELKAGGLQEIEGIKASQADIEIEFEIPSLERAEPFDPTWLLDPEKLCGERGAFVQGGVGPFGLLVLASEDLEEHTAIFFRVYKANNNHMVLMCSDQRRSSSRAGIYKPTYGGFVGIDIEKDRRVSLRTLIDHSVVESFGGGGRTCITARVYPEHLLTTNTFLYAFNNGHDAVKIPELTAWEMATPHVNREDENFAMPK